jgi:hypothetical protein
MNCKVCIPDLKPIYIYIYIYEGGPLKGYAYSVQGLEKDCEREHFVKKYRSLWWRKKCQTTKSNIIHIWETLISMRNNGYDITLS